MSSDNLTTQMRDLLERAHVAGLTSAADWIRQKYFGKEPALESGLAWCVWYSRNEAVSYEQATVEWQKRRALLGNVSEVTQ